MTQAETVALIAAVGAFLGGLGACAAALLSLRQLQMGSLPRFAPTLRIGDRDSLELVLENQGGSVSSVEVRVEALTRSDVIELGSIDPLLRNGIDFFPGASTRVIRIGTVRQMEYFQDYEQVILEEVLEESAQLPRVRLKISWNATGFMQQHFKCFDLTVDRAVWERSTGSRFIGRPGPP